jgi:dTDP-4-amino-4,6-dideoxygalactose transaminase
MSTSNNLIPLNDLGRLSRSDVGADVREALASVFESGWWLNGKQVRAFSDEFASYLQVKHCVPVANGSDALEIAIRCLVQQRGLQGKEVVTVANAGGYSTIACRLVGLTPVYADIETESQLIRLDSLLAALTEQTALVVATHLYGGVVDVRAIRAAMDRAGFGHVPILEDCAQAHGASLRGEKVGTLGDIATYSFYPTKNLGACGDAGAIVTNDPDLANAVEQARQYGWKEKYQVTAPFGRNSRMDEMQAAILRILLPHLDNWNARRKTIVDQYAEALLKPAHMVLSSHGSVGHLAVCLVDDRNAFRTHLQAQGVMSEIHYPVLDCDQPAWQDAGWRESSTGLTVSRASVGRLVTLPCFPTMSDVEVERVCKTLGDWNV